MFTNENFYRGLKNIFDSVKYDESNKTYVLYQEMYDVDDKLILKDIGTLKCFDIEEIFVALTDKTNFNEEYILYSTKKIQAPIERQGGFGSILSRRIDRQNYEVSEHGFTIKLCNKSQEYIVSLICYAGKNNINLKLHNFICKEVNNLEDLMYVLGVCTVELESKEEISIGQAKKMLDSYLFNLAFNYNLILKFSTFTRNRQPLIIKNSRKIGQLFPYKTYMTELVNYYYQGLSTNLPFVQYLAFYHVIEYFFQSVSEKDVFDEIKDTITNPSFSPYKKESLKKFYHKIKKKIQEQKDDGVWNEKNALYLCLKTYIKEKDLLIDFINEIDSSAIEFYTNNDVSFADDGKRINFQLMDDEFFTQLRNRIYSVRNSIVHSKEGEKLRFEPFKHDKDLQKEIPLIRAVAEQVIINSARQLDI